MMAPLTIIDYIAVHEFAHLIHPNHAAAFWYEVDKVLPDYRSGRIGFGRRGRGWICENAGTADGKTKIRAFIV